MDYPYLSHKKNQGYNDIIYLVSGMSHQVIQVYLFNGLCYMHTIHFFLQMSTSGPGLKRCIACCRPRASRNCWEWVSFINLSVAIGVPKWDASYFDGLMMKCLKMFMEYFLYLFTYLFVRIEWDFTRVYPAKKGCNGMKSAAYPLVMTK